MKWMSWTLWIAAAWMAAACHKELCYDHSHETMMEVRFDWSLNPPEESPSMHLALLPTGEEQRDRVEQAFDDPAGGHIVLSRGRYHALAFNRDGDGIELYLDSYDGAYVTTSTTDVVSASTFFGTKSAPLPAGSEGHSVRQQPSLFYADTCSLFTVDMNHTSYLMRPKLLVDTIDVRVEGGEEPGLRSWSVGSHQWPQCGCEPLPIGTAGRALHRPDGGRADRKRYDRR